MATEVPIRTVYKADENGLLLSTHASTILRQRFNGSHHIAVHVFNTGDTFVNSPAKEELPNFIRQLKLGDDFEFFFQGGDNNSPSFKHVYCSHVSSFRPNEGTSTIQVITASRTIMMDLDRKMRVHECSDGVHEVVESVVSEYKKISAITAPCATPQNMKKPVQGRKTDWQFLTGDIPYRTGSDYPYETYTVFGDDVIFAPPGFEGNEWEIDTRNVVIMEEGDDSFNASEYGGNGLTGRSLDHYAKSILESDVDRPGMTGTEDWAGSFRSDTSAPFQDEESLVSYMRHKCGIASLSNFNIGITLGSILPSDIPLPIGRLILPETIQGRHTSTFALVSGINWVHRDNRLVLRVIASHDGRR